MATKVTIAEAQINWSTADPANYLQVPGFISHLVKMLLWDAIDDVADMVIGSHTDQELHQAIDQMKEDFELDGDPALAVTVDDVKHHAREALRAWYDAADRGLYE